MILLNEWRKKCFLPDFKDKSGEKCYTVEQIRDFFIFVMRKNVSGLDPNVNIYSKKVYDAVEFLHKNYSKDISVAMVADALAISESNLSKSFKKETGKSVLDYLTDVRITASKNLLCNTNYKIYQISDMVGYKTSQYFSQVFMKATGVHPGKFREAVENGVSRTIN
jgi:YesN/AraC family two-component response regulator